MKHLSKWHTKHAFCLITILTVLSVQNHAQTDRNEMKLQNLKNKIDIAESNVAAAELKLAKADSLIADGDLRINQAEGEFARIGEEKKKLEKEYRTNTKALLKLAKSKDTEIAKKAKDDLEALEAKHKEESKSQAAEIKMLNRQATSADSDVEKGLDMKKKAIVKLKDARKSLEVARKNYEDFANALDRDKN